MLRIPKGNGGLVYTVCLCISIRRDVLVTEWMEKLQSAIQADLYSIEMEEAAKACTSASSRSYIFPILKRVFGGVFSSCNIN